MQAVDIPKRVTARKRLDLEVSRVAKLETISKEKGRTQAEIVETLIDSLPDPA